MDRKELDKILQDHRKWIDRTEESSEEGMANLQFADLRGTDLSETNLCGANLRMADLEDADLHGAKLCDADLLAANLFRADLRGANLCGANLRDADLCGANLRGADLSCADLREADLQGADLREAYCVGTIFANADLRGADLRGAILWHAYTDGMKTDTATKIDWPMACPETGAFIAWKRAGEHIIKLEIPEEAERSSATTNKCRASMARVLEIQYKHGSKADVTEIMTDRCWIYKVGEMVYPDSWDDNRFNECSHGIHFFMTRDEAVEW